MSKRCSCGSENRGGNAPRSTDTGGIESCGFGGRLSGDGAGIEAKDFKGILGTLEGGLEKGGGGGDGVAGEVTKSPKRSDSEYFLPRFGFGGVGGGGGEDLEDVGLAETGVATAEGVKIDPPLGDADAKSPKSSSPSSTAFPGGEVGKKPPNVDMLIGLLVDVEA